MVGYLVVGKVEKKAVQRVEPWADLLAVLRAEWWACL
jgi:hypothetical protein